MLLLACFPDRINCHLSLLVPSVYTVQLNSAKQASIVRLDSQFPSGAEPIEWSTLFCVGVVFLSNRYTKVIRLHRFPLLQLGSSKHPVVLLDLFVVEWWNIKHSLTIRITRATWLTRLPDYPATWLPGYPTTRLSDYPDYPDYPTTRLPDYPATWLPGYPTTRLSDYPDYPDYPATRLPGYPTTRPDPVQLRGGGGGNKPDLVSKPWSAAVNHLVAIFTTCELFRAGLRPYRYKACFSGHGENWRSLNSPWPGSNSCLQTMPDAWYVVWIMHIHWGES